MFGGEIASNVVRMVEIEPRPGNDRMAADCKEKKTMLSRAALCMRQRMKEPKSFKCLTSPLDCSHARLVDRGPKCGLQWPRVHGEVLAEALASGNDVVPRCVTSRQCRSESSWCRSTHGGNWISLHISKRVPKQDADKFPWTRTVSHAQGQWQSSSDKVSCSRVQTADGHIHVHINIYVSR